MTWSARSWREAAKDYHKDRGNRLTTNTIDPERLAQLRALMPDDISLDRTGHELGRNRPAPQALVDALVFSLRRGVNELTKPETQRRLSALDKNQLKEVCRRVQNFKPEIAASWSTEEVAALIAAKEALL